ncbi:phosphoglycerate kinase [Patescibacteria group bacterium]|nr:phosphoglycerate kinase [Patescibacteria group bacterium]
MKLKSYKSAKLKGKGVILRVALETPITKTGGKFLVEDDTRLKVILPTIRYLLKNGCKIVLVSYAGRPQGKNVPELRLDPQAEHLSKLLGKKVNKLSDCIGPQVEKIVGRMKAGDIVLLENTRFHPEERANDSNFAKALAKLGDIFINDAFAQSYEPHASTTAITNFLPSYAGPLLLSEVKMFSKVLEKPRRPWVAIIGGAKISNKIKVIKTLLKKADYVLLGGALANTILTAQGIQVGKSLIEKEYVEIAKELKVTDIKLKIPVDVVVATKKITPESKCRPVGAVQPDEIILDIGPDTVELYKMIINKAKTVVWNGPMGKYEMKEYSYGSIKIAEAIASARADTFVGGGETVDVIRDNKLEKKFDFISTGGGAMLKFLQYGTLPALKPLTIK